MPEKLTDEEVRDFARQMVRRELFTTWNIAPGDMNLVTSIFMPLMLMNDEQRDQMLADEVEVLHAPMSAQQYRAINGYPMFMEFGYWSKQDAERVWAVYERMEEAMKSV